MLDTIKETVGKAAYNASVAVEAASEYIDEHPSVIYAGLLGLSFAVGMLHADTKKDLQEIKNKLD